MNKIKRSWVKHSPSDYLDIMKLCLELYETPKIISDKNNSYVLSKLNMLRYVCNLNAVGKDLCMRNILIDCLHNAHNRCPGSEIWIPKMLMNDYEVQSNYRVSSKESLEYTLEIMHNSRAKRIFKSAIGLLGSSGKIIVEDFKINRDAIEIRTGYKVNLSHDSRFIEMVGKSSFYLDNAHILVIEGAPSSVSELNKILEKAHKDNIQMILVARSFPEEVSATLATNWLKNKLSIIPMIYGNFLENINSHADILAISAGIPISKALGDTLNIDSEERFGHIYNVHIDNSGLMCHTNNNIDNHVNNLKLKVKEFKPGEEDKNILYHERISGLTNNLLSIKLKQTKDVFLVKEELNIAISYYNNMCYMNSDIIINNRKHVIPKNMFDIALEISKSFIESVNSIGGFLIKA